MPSGMNARPRSSTSILVPTFGEEGDRSAVACATRITALNISFISGPEQLPYSTNMRSEHCRDVRDRAYVHASHPAVVAAAITGDAAIRMVNETRPHPPLAFLLFVFFTSFRFAFPLARSLSPLPLSFSYFSLRSSFLGRSIDFLRANKDDSEGRTSCRSCLARDKFVGNFAQREQLREDDFSSWYDSSSQSKIAMMPDAEENPRVYALNIVNGRVALTNKRSVIRNLHATNSLHNAMFYRLII